MKKQYIIQKYVMAESVSEAISKSKKLPIHEVFLHNDWFQKVAGSEFSSKQPIKGPGFKS